MRSNTGLVVEEPVTSCTSPKATNSSAPRATTKGVERPVARDPAAVTAPRLRIVHGDVAFGQLDPFDTVVRGAAHQQHRSIAVHYRRMKRQAGSVMGSPGVRRRVVADKTRSQRPIRLARFAVYVQLAVEHGHRCAAESLG